MLSPIQLQHILMESLKTVEPVVKQIFICNFDGSCLAHTAQQGQPDQIALLSNLSMLFDDCQEIGRLRLSQDEEGKLNYALIEVENLIAVLLNFNGCFIVGVSADQNRSLGLILQSGQKIIRDLDKQLFQNKQ